jgi:xanthine dehydrogenase accessory factor
MTIKILLRGGGDLASGAALRMARIGMRVLICELARPYAVRRTVSFAEAIYTGKIEIERVICQLIPDYKSTEKVFDQGIVPILIDPDLDSLELFGPDVIVDGRMMKESAKYFLQPSSMVIGLGPGFTCGLNCHAAIETSRGPNLGRVIWDGSPEKDTGIPERVGPYTEERVLRAPIAGVFQATVNIGDSVSADQIVGYVNQQPIKAIFDGLVRGILHNGLSVTAGLKLGDIDPRINPSIIDVVSDKALSIGGGVLEAILTWPINRKKLAGN